MKTKRLSTCLCIAVLSIASSLAPTYAIADTAHSEARPLNTASSERDQSTTKAKRNVRDHRNSNRAAPVNRAEPTRSVPKKEEPKKTKEVVNETIKQMEEERRKLEAELKQLESR